jgi:predicted naringenin-chalcone synthase
MVAVVSHPSVVVPDHAVPMKKVLDHIAALHSDHPQCAAMLKRAANTGVQTRHTVLPFEQVIHPAPLGERNVLHLAEAVNLGEKAARRALPTAGLQPRDVDSLIVACCTGHALPGVDAHLIQRLDLRPDIRRLPMAQMGCAGGAYALTRAAADLTAHPGQQVLVVCVELSSLSYQPTDASVPAAISSALFGDAAAACVVHDRAEPGVALPGPVLNYLLPDTLSDISYWLNETGLHFETQPGILGFVPRVAPVLIDWLKATAGDGPVVPDWIISHTGGPKIMDQLGQCLAVDDTMFRHSRQSLREIGNVASVVVLDVLARTYTDPPADGTTGLLIAFGPGFTTIAARATWHR